LVRGHQGPSQEEKDNNYHICEPFIVPQGLSNWHGRLFNQRSQTWTCFFRLRAKDNGRDVKMTARPAEDNDKVESDIRRDATRP